MTWVHLYEEDAGGREVYRPEDTKIPLSRRPRERIELRDDGTASVFMPGPDDRFVEQQASWTVQGDQTVIRTNDGRFQLVVVEESPSRLVVERRRTADKG